MQKIKIISPGESKLAKAIKLDGYAKSNGPIFDFNGLDNKKEFHKLELNRGDLQLSYSVVIDPRKGRGGKQGHYHADKKEIFVTKDSEFLLFLSDLSDKREIIYLNTRVPKNKKRFKFPVMCISPGISHYIYNPTDHRQYLDVLSKTSDKVSQETTYEFDAVGTSIDRIVRAFHASRR